MPTSPAPRGAAKGAPSGSCAPGQSIFNQKTEQTQNPEHLSGRKSFPLTIFTCGDAETPPRERSAARDSPLRALFTPHPRKSQPPGARLEPPSAASPPAAPRPPGNRAATARAPLGPNPQTRDPGPTRRCLRSGARKTHSPHRPLPLLQTQGAEWAGRAGCGPGTHLATRGLGRRGATWRTRERTAKSREPLPPHSPGPARPPRSKAQPSRGRGGAGGGQREDTYLKGYIASFPAHPGRRWHLPRPLLGPRCPPP